MMRACGGCTLCCKLLPVPTLGKRAGHRCEHQRHGKGCAIYARRPPECAQWSCRWLMDADATRGLSRPDRAHYVIDPMPDYVRLADNETGIVTEVPVIQIWIDAQHPHAHRDPALRAYLDAEAKRTGMAALVRMAGNEAATSLFAPSISADGQWHAVVSNFKEKPHSAGDVARVMRNKGLHTRVVVEP